MTRELITILHTTHQYKEHLFFETELSSYERLERLKLLEKSKKYKKNKNLFSNY